MQRRIFLMAGGSLLAYATPPADQTTLGVIGSGSRGTFVMGVFQKDPVAARLGHLRCLRTESGKGAVDGRKGAALPSR